ncbi:MAG: diguanylate cyclase [Methylococcales bacterium]|nr:diguanylate cyclase [Methylococcales bacterium]
MPLLIYTVIDYSSQSGDQITSASIRHLNQIISETLRDEAFSPNKINLIKKIQQNESILFINVTDLKGNNVFFAGADQYKNNQTSNKNVKATTIPWIDHYNQVNGQITWAYDLRILNQFSKKSNTYTIMLLIFYISMAFLFSFFLKKTLVDPLGYLREASHKVASGDMNVDLNVNSSLSEVMGLASDLDKMREELVDQAAALKFEALHDALTGLSNRGATEEVLERENARALRSNHRYTVVLFDLDHFKQVNDNYGHAAGDTVLVAVASMAKQVFREGDLVGRWGGEEFLCVLPETLCDDAMLVTERLRKMVCETPIPIEGRDLSVSISIGVATFDSSCNHFDDLVKLADARMYEAKRTGRNKVIGHGGSNLTDSLADQIETALKESKITVKFEPIYNLKDHEIVAEIACPIITTKESDEVINAHFRESATQLKLIHQIDYAIVKETIVRCIETNQSRTNNIIHFVKISMELVQQAKMIDELILFAKQQCEACSTMNNMELPIVFEIAENELLGNSNQVTQVLQPFLDFGIQLAISDFGKGNASFEYLANLPITYLNVDKNLVSQSDNDEQTLSICKGIQNIVNDLNIISIAKNIDNKETLNKLKIIGVNWVHGSCDIDKGNA